ncbi:hypothetical protein [Vreelandella massiliensis]|uniref:hypothetical protein n=1 Tax=Vreelandella massiliensis TaxID=1816686 RepID=UPI00096A5FC3|nr:hypothetical protein [Halomonas massiliensis]
MSAANAARESRKTAKPLKIELALDMLIRADRESRYVMQYDASDEYGETCFHTTISTLRDKGIDFLQLPYKHTHRHGGTAHFQSYRISPKSRAAALNLANHYAAMRGGSL